MSILQRIGFLAFFGALISLYTLYHHTEVVGGFLIERSFCSFGDTFDCDVVTRSKFAVFLGVPVAVWTLMYYLVLLVYSIGLEKPSTTPSATDSRKLTAHDERSLGTFFLATLSIPPSIGLLLVSVFIIKKLCLLCAMMDLVNVLLLGLTWFGLARSLRSARSPWASFVLGGKAFFRALFNIEGPDAARLLSTAAFGIVFGLTLPLGLTELYFKPRAEARFALTTLQPLLDAWRIAPVENIPIVTDGDPLTKDFAHGPANALVTVVEFADFECPYCKRTATYLKTLFNEKDTSLRVVYKPFPLDQKCNRMITKKLHEFSCRAASIARCAGQQGDDSFWKMHDALVGLESFSDESLDELVTENGFSLESIKKCEDEGKAIARVAQDVDLGEKLKISQTPTLFVNGRRMIIRPDYVPGFIKLIQAELSQPKAP